MQENSHLLPGEILSCRLKTVLQSPSAVGRFREHSQAEQLLTEKDVLITRRCGSVYRPIPTDLPIWSKFRHVQIGAKDLGTPFLALIWGVEPVGDAGENTVHHGVVGAFEEFLVDSAGAGGANGDIEAVLELLHDRFDPLSSVATAQHGEVATVHFW